MRKISWIPLAAATLTALSVLGQGNVVVNGGFESFGSTPTGWSTTLGWTWTGGNPAAAEGQAFLYLTGNVYQDLPTVPGQVYQLRFAIAGDPVYQGQVTLQTFWAGSLALTIVFNTTGHSNENLGWVYVTNNFLATAPTTRLWFANPNSGTTVRPLLDAVSAIPVNETPTTCITPPAGIISSWKAASNAVDSVAANHGTLLNGASFAAGEVGFAFSFNGNGQCVQIPYSSSLASSNYSVEAWVNPQAQLSGPSTQAVIFAQNNGQGQLLARMGTSGLRVALQFAVDSTTSVDVQSASEILIGQFSHIAGTWDGTNLSIYVNGVLDAQSAPGVAPINSTCPFYIGGISNSAAGSCSNVAGFFNGLIDEVSYYTRALSQSEIQFIFLADGSGKCALAHPPLITSQPLGATIYAGASVTFNVAATGDAPLGYQWQFNGSILTGQTSNSLTFTNVQSAKAGNYTVSVINAAGSTLSSNAVLTVLPPPPCAPIPPGLVSWWRAEGDLSDGWDGNDGALAGSSAIYPPPSFGQGKVGRAFSFVSGGLIVYDGPALRFTTGITIEGWVNASNLTGLRTILCKFDPPNIPQTNSSYYFGTTNGALLFKLSSHGSNIVMVTATNSLPPTQWTHVAATYDGAALRVYVNAAPVGELSNSDGIFPGFDDIGIGALPHAAQGAWFLPWSGSIDEISLYNRALSGAEIASIYSADLTGKCSSLPIITSQPQNQAVPLNEDALFSLGVVGTKPFKYQWRFNGINLFGATNSRLLLEKVQSNVMGSYSVIITNALGRATSSAAALTLLPALTCVTAPTGMVAWWPGNDFTNDVVGTNNVFLSTHPPNQLLPYSTGKVAQSFTFSNSYAFALDSPSLNFGSNAGFSLEGWIKVSGTNNPAPPIQIDIASKIYRLDANRSAIGYALLLSNGRLACQLVNQPFNLTNIPTFISASGDLRDGMFHHVGMTVARSAADGGRLYLDGQPVMTFDPRSIRGSLSNSAELLIGQAPPFSTQVTRIDELTIYNRALSAADLLSVYQAGSAGKCIPLPHILVQPTNQTVNVGATATFRVVSSGYPPLSYQWWKGGSPVPASTNTALAITNAALTDAAQYVLTISNLSGSVTSAVATLIVNRPPTASNMVAATRQNVPISIPVAKLMFYASDADGDPLSLASVSGTSMNGGLVTRSSTDVTYNPAFNFLGADSFTWTVGDGRGGSGSASVFVQVRSTNDVSGNFLPPTTIPGGFRVTFLGIPGLTYRVQRSETVFGPWSNVTSVTAGPDGLATYDDTNSPPPTAFYRTVYP